MKEIISAPELSAVCYSIILATIVYRRSLSFFKMDDSFAALIKKNSTKIHTTPQDNLMNLHGEQFCFRCVFLISIRQTSRIFIELKNKRINVVLWMEFFPNSLSPLAVQSTTNAGDTNCNICSNKIQLALLHASSNIVVIVVIFDAFYSFFFNVVFAIFLQRICLAVSCTQLSWSDRMTLFSFSNRYALAFELSVKFVSTKRRRKKVNNNTRPTHNLISNGCVFSGMNLAKLSIFHVDQFWCVCVCESVLSYNCAIVNFLFRCKFNVHNLTLSRYSPAFSRCIFQFNSLFFSLSCSLLALWLNEFYDSKHFWSFQLRNNTLPVFPSCLRSVDSNFKRFQLCNYRK